MPLTSNAAPVPTAISKLIDATRGRSVLLLLIIALGLVVGLLEGWSIHESIYFAFVSGLTIGYGDLSPKSLLTRVLAIAIGVCGVLVTALVAAIAVKALTAATDEGER